MATNALDDTILDFYDQNDAIAGDDAGERTRLLKKLGQQLQERFLQIFGVSCICLRFNTPSSCRWLTWIHRHP